jgi:hypothetical protein
MLVMLAKSQYYELELTSAQTNLQKLSITNDRLYVVVDGTIDE